MNRNYARAYIILTNGDWQIYWEDAVKCESHGSPSSVRRYAIRRLRKDGALPELSGGWRVIGYGAADVDCNGQWTKPSNWAELMYRRSLRRSEHKQKWQAA